MVKTHKTVDLHFFFLSLFLTLVKKDRDLEVQRGRRIGYPTDIPVKFVRNRISFMISAVSLSPYLMVSKVLFFSPSRGMDLFNIRAMVHTAS